MSPAGGGSRGRKNSLMRSDGQISRGSEGEVIEFDLMSIMYNYAFI